MEEIKVLIVDDEPDVSSLMKLRLDREAPHLTILTVEGAAECVAFLKDHEADCILSDYQMPGMDGMELLQALRAKGDNIPFIFVTGQGSEQIARDAFKSGANDYFTKEVGFAHFARIVNSIEQAVRQRRAEDAKREELIFRRAIEDSVLSGIVGVDSEGRINYVNPAFCRMVGWDEDELIGASPPFEFWPPEERDNICTVFQLIMEGRMQSRSLELKFMRKNGERFYVQKLVSEIKDIQGRSKGWLNAVYDITARKKMEDALRESENKFRNLVEKSLVGVYLIQEENSRYVFKYANLTEGEIFGYSVEEMVGRMGPDDLVFPEDRPLVRENIRRRLAGESESMHYFFRGLKKGGGVIDVEVYGTKTTYLGRPAIIGTLLDVTERRRAEEALEESSIMFKGLAEGALVGIYLVQDGRFAYVNPQFCRMIGYSVEELMRMDTVLEVIAPQDGEATTACIANVLSGGAAHYQRHWLRKDGRVMDIEGTASLSVYGGRPAVIGTAIDITERKALERQREDFYAMVTHDLKSPLTSIIGYAELLLEKNDGKFDAESREMLASILGSGEKLRRLVEDFLSISQMEAGKLAFNLFPSDLPQVLEQAHEGLERAIRERGLTFRTDIAGDIPKVIIDQKLVQRAVYNLLQNAVNYTQPGGEITLRAELVEEGFGRFVMVSVTDTGRGVPAEEQGRIFEKYYRSPRTSGIKGTGLGLAIVKAVAEGHEGWVELESSVGKGSTFRLFLSAELGAKQAA